MAEIPEPRPDSPPVPGLVSVPELAPDEKGTARGVIPLVLFLYGIVALFAFGFALFSGGLADLLRALDPTREPGRLGAGLAGAVGLGIALVVVSRVGARNWGPMRRLTEGLVDLFGAIRIRDALLLALVSGFAEELLFRGALFPHLELVGTTLLFGLVHVIPRRSFWVYPLFATLAGLLFGILRDGTDSLWPPIVAHVTVNAVNLAWIGTLARKRTGSREVAEAR